MKSTNDVVLTFATKLFILPLSLLIGIVISRMLGPANKGFYVYLNLILVLATTWGSLGFGAGITYNIANLRFNIEGTYYTITIIALSFGFVSGGLIWFVYSMKIVPMQMVNPHQMICLLIALPFSFFTLFHTRYLTAISAFQKLNLLLFIQTINAAIIVLPSIVILGNTPTAIVISVLITQISIAIFVLFLTLPKNNLQYRINKSFTVECFRYGSKVLIGDAALNTSFRFDQVILGSILPTTQLGYYALAVNLSEMLWYISDSVGKVLYPKIAGMKETKDAARLTNQILRIVFALTCITACLLGFTSTWLINMLYGSEYLPTAQIMYFLLPASIAYLGIKIFSKYLSGVGQPSKVSVAQVAGATSALILYLVLIPRLGMIGAGLGSLISYTISSAVGWYFYQGETKTKLAEVLIPTRNDINFVIKRFEDLFLLLRKTIISKQYKYLLRSIF